MISEEARHQRYTRLEETLGDAEAATLMAYLPPLGWGDVATKDDVRGLQRDLSHLEGRLGARFEVMESRFEAKLSDVQAAVGHQNRGLFMSMLTLQFTAFGLFLAASHLT